MNESTESLKPLMDSIFIEKALRARRTPMDEKILDGPRLFDMNCSLVRNGIRAQFPNYNDEQVEQELGRRLAIARRIADAGIYRDIEETDE
jgi:hypothetical protein